MLARSLEGPLVGTECSSNPHGYISPALLGGAEVVLWEQ